MRLRTWWCAFVTWSLVGCGVQEETAGSGPPLEAEEPLARACGPAQVNEVTTLLPPDRQWQSPVSLEPRPESLTEVQGTLYFRVEEHAGDATLWKSDGTAAGTVALARLPAPGGAAPEQRLTHFTPVGAKLFLQVFQPETGRELWASDGSPSGTRLLGDLTPGSDGSTLSDLGALNGALSFFRHAPGGIELWRSDGTPSGTDRLLRVAAATALTPGQTLRSAAELRLFFLHEDSAKRLRLWRTDGTARGTRPVQAFAADASVEHTHEQRGAMLFFVREPAAGRFRLWRTDGTLTGTTPLRELGAGASIAHGLRLNGERFFLVHEPGQEGLRLWGTDGTTQGTRLVTHLEGTGGSHIAGHHLQDGTALLRVVVPGAGTEVWRTDGTREGTRRVGAIDASATVLGFTSTAAVWLQRHAHAPRLEVWRMDLATGLHERLAAITNPHEGLEGAFPSIQRVAQAGGRFYVTQSIYAPWGPAIIDVRLWVTDGTVEGTRELSTELSMSTDHHSALFDTGTGQLMFDTRSGLSLTDGTVEGTVPLTSSSPNAPSFPGPFLRLGDTVYFSALAGNPGFTLWSYPVGSTCGRAAR
ncbi:putative lipoprotein [Corallococcus macrosporus]|uniref:Putative lipoprotein n=1 Tax=Myxococcus fulvus (strain ATCC BAA-855 / HW-1) TaxID=483219 RepID=F8CRY3_MYXFH|nr:putative lipoprotein [Corallococcus macrosporus]AEI68061.1 putative lipoprotein [Corallococcus macrosporus]